MDHQRPFNNYREAIGIRQDFNMAEHKKETYERRVRFSIQAYSKSTKRGETRKFRLYSEGV